MAKIISGHQKLKDTLYLDLRKDVVEPGTVIEFESLPEGKNGIVLWAYDKESSNDEVYDGNLYGLDKVKIVGPGRGTKTCGVHIENASFTEYSRMNISEFGTGVKFGPNTWSTVFHNTNIYRCGVALKAKVPKNFGECMRFESCNFFNCYALVEAQFPCLTMNFFGCSFDYPSGYFFLLDGARANLYGCHLEGDVARMSIYPIKVEGNAIFNLQGGQIDLNNSNPLRTLAALFHSDRGRIYIENARMCKIPAKTLIHEVNGGDVKIDNILKIEAPKYVKSGSWKRL